MKTDNIEELTERAEYAERRALELASELGSLRDCALEAIKMINGNENKKAIIGMFSDDLYLKEFSEFYQAKMP